MSARLPLGLPGTSKFRTAFPAPAWVVALAALLLACHPPAPAPADGGAPDAAGHPAASRIVVGAPCRTNDECAGGLCLPETDPTTGEPTGFVGGYCTEDACASGPGRCPAGSHCYGAPGGVCLADCSGAQPCRPGYACAPTAQGGACVPVCKADADCPGEVCVRATGLCGPDVRGVKVGRACAADGDCGPGGLCLTAALGFPDGLCTATPCDPTGAQPSATCPAGAVCAGSTSSPLCLPACEDDLNCRSGYLCLGGTCTPKCTSDAGCGEARVCDRPSGRCVPDLRLAANVGGPCTEKTEQEACGASGTCLPEASGGRATGYAGGYCTALSCAPDAPGRQCPAGARCFGAGLDALCLAVCDPASSSCRPGYACTSSGLCLPACRADADCDPAGTARLACDLPTGLCVPRFDDVPVGAACLSDQACGTYGACLEEGADGSFAGGYCTALPCGAASPCPHGAVCTGSGTPICLAGCAAPGDCRAGYACAGGVCLPACHSDAGCPATFLCDSATGLCQPSFSDVPVGAQCADDSACGTHGNCFGGGDGYPGGYCSAVGCSQVSPCPAGSFCSVGGGTSYCVKSCAATTSCRNPYHCYQLADGTGCLP